jgi:hypothetical protein
VSCPGVSSVRASDEESVAGTCVPSVGRGGFSWKKLGAVVAPLGVVPVLVWIGIPLCPSRSMFGVPCPGCGLSRATIAMLELDFHRVLEMHPLAPLVAPLVAWWMTSAILTSAGLRSAARWDPGKILPRWFWATLGVAMIGLFVVRLGGLFGGLPDRIDPASGLFGRIALAIASLFGLG